MRYLLILALMTACTNVPKEHKIEVGDCYQNSWGKVIKVTAVGDFSSRVTNGEKDNVQIVSFTDLKKRYDVVDCFDLFDEGE